MLFVCQCTVCGSFLCQRTMCVSFVVSAVCECVCHLSCLPFVSLSLLLCLLLCFRDYTLPCLCILCLPSVVVLSWQLVSVSCVCVCHRGFCVSFLCCVCHCAICVSFVCCVCHFAAVCHLCVLCAVLPFVCHLCVVSAILPSVCHLCVVSAIRLAGSPMNFLQPFCNTKCRYRCLRSRLVRRFSGSLVIFG